MSGTPSAVPPVGPSPRRFLEAQASQPPDRVNKGFFEALGPLPVPPILDTQRAPGQLPAPPFVNRILGRAQEMLEPIPLSEEQSAGGWGNGGEECCSQPARKGVGLTKDQEEQGWV